MAAVDGQQDPDLGAGGGASEEAAAAGSQR